MKIGSWATHEGFAGHMWPAPQFEHHCLTSCYMQATRNYCFAVVQVILQMAQGFDNYKIDGFTIKVTF